MEKQSILIVEDEENLHHSLRLNFELEGYEVTSAFDGIDAIKKLENEYFHLVILDIMLPGIDGLKVLENMRLNKIDSPVLILSARGTPPERIAGLKLGANDYLPKPFELEELLLRARLLLSTQTSRQVTDQAVIGPHSIDFATQTATLAGGKVVELSKKETMLLQLLVQHPNEVITREKILQAVWGYNVYPNTRTIDNFILSFRKYFEEDSRNPRYIHSIRGQGYKFTP